MLRSYLKYALRYLWKNKIYSLINIGGLAIGLSSCILLFTYVQDQFSYDTFNNKADNLYRVNLIRLEQDVRLAGVSPPMGEALLNDHKEIKNFTRLRHGNTVLIRVNDDQFFEERLFYVDTSFLSMFSYPLIKGNREQALLEKNTAVISSNIAEKYFSDKDPIGQVLEIDNTINVEVTGVIDVPDNSHFKFEILVSFSTFEVPFGYPVDLQSWRWTSFPTYVELSEETDHQAVNEELNAFVAKYMGEETAETISLELQPLLELHLYSQGILPSNAIPTSGDSKNLYVLLAIAILILGIALFNFVNLSTTLSLKRVKEIGVRKTLGAHKSALFIQHCAESILLSLLSLIIALTILEVFNASLSSLLGVETISIRIIENLPAFLGLIFLVGFLGGLYPAIFLSKYSPVKALKGKEVVKKRKFSLRTILITCQFFITIALVASSIVINKQMNYMQSVDLGYQKENLIALRMLGEDLRNRYETTKNWFLQNPYVKSVTASGEMFDGNNGSVPIWEKGYEETSHRINIFSGHHDFSKTMGFQFVAGRDFSEKYANDSTKFILNEAAVRMFGWKDDPIGKSLILNNVWPGEVVGVVKDFNFNSLRHHIEPLIMYMPKTLVDIVYIKTTAGPKDQIIASLQADWKKLHPELPFDYTFLENHLETMYEGDKQFSNLVYSFTSLAIFLACMGLYGIVAYNIDSRKKEIGIRKVLGASIRRIMILLSQQFLLLIIFSSAFAIPIVWHFLNNWLEEFAYKTSISIVQLAMAIAVTLIIAMLTLSLRTFLAAKVNPVESLKEN